MEAKSSVEGEPYRRELVNGGGEHEHEQVHEQELEKEVVHPLTAFLTMAGFACDDGEEGEEDDEEWRPNILCTNCTMPNPVDGERCNHCRESLRTHILEQPILGGPLSSSTGNERQVQSYASTLILRLLHAQLTLGFL